MNTDNRIIKGVSLLSDSLAFQWCYVNVDNEFVFMDSTFIIDDSVEEYVVHNKVGYVEDFTNEAYMEEILVVLHSDNTLKFYNQNFDEIDNAMIRVKD